MMNETILGYVVGERARGVADEAIRGALLAQGWKEEDVVASMAGGAVTVATTGATGPKQYSFGNLFQGRLMRWQSFSHQFMLSILFCILVAVLFGASYVTDMDAIMWLAFLLYIPFVVLSFSITVRRIHDLNWSGWLFLLMFVPFIGGVFALVVLFMKGTVGPNKYGPDQADRNFKSTILNL